MIDRNFILNLAHVSGDINEYLMSLYNIPVQMKAKTIVEIGAGVSTFALVAAAKETGGKVTSIDIGGYGALDRVPNGAEIIRQFNLDNPNVMSMWNRSSLDVPVIKSIDFFFHDSEHTYDLSKSEFAKWFPQVRKGGIIAIHDTGHESPEKQGAIQALNEFMQSEEGKSYRRIDLMDTKIIGMSILMKGMR